VTLLYLKSKLSWFIFLLRMPFLIHLSGFLVLRLKMKNLCLVFLFLRAHVAIKHLICTCLFLACYYLEDSYQHTKYHKQTKNQWARDDPAFVVILILFLVFATSAYCAAYGESASHAALTITSVVFFHFLFAGIVLATLCW
jgi:hypothetical protein